MQIKNNIRKYQKQDFKKVSTLIKKFYTEDPTYKSITQKKIRLTSTVLLSYPEKGTMLVIENGKKLLDIVY